MPDQITQTGPDPDVDTLFKNNIALDQWQDYLQQIRAFEKSAHEKFLLKFSDECRKEILANFDHNCSGLIKYLETTINEFTNSVPRFRKSVFDKSIKLNKTNIEKGNVSINNVSVKVEDKKRLSNESKMSTVTNNLSVPIPRCPEAEKALQMLSYRGPPKIYKCSQCSRHFKTLNLILQHKEICGKTRFLCNYCHSKFGTIEELTEHEKQHAGESIPSHKLLKEALQLPLSQCNRCKNRLWWETKNNQGQGLDAKNFKCDLCDTWLSRREILTHCSECHITDKPYECEKCQATFQKVHTLREHKLTRHQEKLGSVILCSICYEKFLSKSDYEKHRETMHQSDKPYQCGFCGEHFKFLSVQKHHETLHTGETPFPCDFCTESFRTPRFLKHHRFRHLDVWPFKCDICLDPFYLRQGLVRHTMVHQSGPNVEWHYCPQCNVHFRSGGALRQHRLKNKLLKRKCGEDVQCDDPAGELSKPKKKKKKSVEIVPCALKTVITPIPTNLNSVNLSSTGQQQANCQSFAASSTSNIANYTMNSSIASQPLDASSSSSSTSVFQVPNSSNAFNMLAHSSTSSVLYESTTISLPH